MTLPEFFAQMKYWRKHPPMHKLLAAYVKYKPPAEETPGDYKAAAAPTAEWFADPARFFAGNRGGRAVSMNDLERQAT